MNAVAAMSETVAINRLDTLVNALGLVRLDFIKVDIEGHEAAFAEGAIDTLERFRPALMMECDHERMIRAGSEPAGFRALMETLGYRSHGIRTGALHEVSRLDHGSSDVFWIHADRRLAGRASS